MPGDRKDDSIKSVGEFCSRVFDQIYIKEDANKRNRRDFEVARLFYDEIIKNGFDQQKIQIIQKELDALKEAINNAKNNDLIVVFYEDLEPLQQLLKEQEVKDELVSVTS
jgi:cyanophycin synthetase